MGGHYEAGVEGKIDVCVGGPIDTGVRLKEVDGEVGVVGC